jgi:hypothetical protein
MRRAVIAVLAVLACLAAAAPASAQAPDPDATIDVTVTCTSNQTMFRVLASGLNPGEPYGVLVENAEGTGVLGATGSDISSGAGDIEAGFGSNIPSGTYTVYAYTGPYQNLAPASTWPGSIEVDSFQPELTTSYVSTTVQTNCGPGSTDDCKMDGWQTGGYRNQGQCVSRFAQLQN